MASKKLTGQLTELVSLTGGARRSESAILETFGASPSKSAIDRAIRGAGSDYTVKCMIQHLRIYHGKPAETQ